MITGTVATRTAHSRALHSVPLLGKCPDVVSTARAAASAVAMRPRMYVNNASYQGVLSPNGALEVMTTTSHQECLLSATLQISRLLRPFGGVESTTLASPRPMPPQKHVA